MKLTLALTAILLMPVATEAHAPYSATVKEARTWLKERVSDKAFRCAHILLDRESHWNTRAENRYSGAYGIPQALPWRKMESEERPDPAWNNVREDPLPQVSWAKKYVKARYAPRNHPRWSGFCSALRFQSTRGYY